MRIGFTGTRDGMTANQRAGVAALLKSHPPTVAVHGDCVGADEEFNQALNELGTPIRVEIYPALVKNQMRAYCASWPTKHLNYLVLPARPPLDRNRDIVDRCDLLIAAPKQTFEVLRSGTWATIRYARQRNRLLFIVWPDGSIAGEYQA